jgi:hypothetical protein
MLFVTKAGIIMPEFRKPERLEGILLLFSSRFIKIQSLSGRNQPGAIYIHLKQTRLSRWSHHSFLLTAQGDINGSFRT